MLHIFTTNLRLNIGKTKFYLMVYKLKIIQENAFSEANFSTFIHNYIIILLLKGRNCKYYAYDSVFDSIGVLVSDIFEPQNDKTNKITCAPSKDSGLIRVFAVRSMGI